MRQADENSDRPSSGLLSPRDPEPVGEENLGGSSPILLLGDHAGRAIPAALEDLGLDADSRARHIAWDIGVHELGLDLSRRLDAAFLHQRYSRLVIDCNRHPSAAGSILAQSDGVPIPGNFGLAPGAAEMRRRAVFEPYHAMIRAVLEARRSRGRPTLLVSLHSFTPVMAGFSRPWRFGVLHRGDSPLSSAVLAALAALGAGPVGDNEPYAMAGQDYTVPVHADAMGLDYLELEVRQDLIAAPEGVGAAAALIVAALTAATAGLGGLAGSAEGPSAILR